MKIFVAFVTLASIAWVGAEPPLPQNSYLPPNQQAQAPSNTYLAPQNSYQAPSNNYLPPSRSGGGSSGSSSAPSGSYGAPSNSYGAPARNGGHGGGYGGDEGNYGPAKYEFKYDVQDYESGNDFGHMESRDGDLAIGRYYVLLPDGRKQIVDYEADQNGYRPTIRYEQVNNGRNGNNGAGYGNGANGGYDSNAQNKFSGYQ